MDQYQFSAFPMLISFILFMLLLLKLWLQKRNLSPNLPPGPRKLPLIGNLHQLLGDLPHRRLRDLASKNGTPLMHLQLGEVPFIIASSSETAKQIMKVHDLNFASRPNSLGAEILHYNRKAIILAPYGNLLRNLKKICKVELLSPKRVQQFRSIREEEILNLIRDIRSSESHPINLSKMLYSSSYNIIIKALIGKKAKNGDKYIGITERAVKLFGGFSVVDVFPSSKLLLMMSGMKSKFKNLHEDADEILENIIQEHKAERESCGSSVMEDDLVHILLGLQEQGKLDPPLTNDSVKGVIQDLIFGGIDTSATTVEWAMSEMLKCPRVLQKAQAEVREVFGKEGKINEGEFDKLNYIKLVIKEVLRLHPPLPLLVPREASKSCQINGYEIPAKAHVIVNAWAIGRDPKCWTDPENFNPERFIGSSIDFRGTDFGFLPFGAGRRICPGITFGLANVEISLVQLLCHFEWKLPDGKASEDLDMTENSGLSARRKHDLFVIPLNKVVC